MLSRQRGFTLPELLVAGGIIALILIAGAFFISSKVDVDEERRDAQRRIDIATLALSFQSYMSERKELPSGISSEEQFIGNAEGEYDLCALLVPDFAQDLPFDPLSGAISAAKTCPVDGSDYSNGYSIQQKDNVIILAAPFGETGHDIKIDLKY